MLYKYSVLHISHFAYIFICSFQQLYSIGYISPFYKTESEALEKLNDLLRLSDSSTFSYLLNQLASQIPDQCFLVVDLSVVMEMFCFRAAQYNSW